MKLQILNFQKENPGVSVIFDENWNVLEQKKTRTFGSGTYSGVMFRCSKCGKLYTTHGALNYYHKRCGQKIEEVIKTKLQEEKE